MIYTHQFFHTHIHYYTLSDNKFEWHMILKKNKNILGAIFSEFWFSGSRILRSRFFASSFLGSWFLGSGFLRSWFSGSQFLRSRFLGSWFQVLGPCFKPYQQLKPYQQINKSHYQPVTSHRTPIQRNGYQFFLPFFQLKG